MGSLGEKTCLEHEGVMGAGHSEVGPTSVSGWWLSCPPRVPGTRRPVEQGDWLGCEQIGRESSAHPSDYGILQGIT